MLVTWAQNTTGIAYSFPAPAAPPDGPAPFSAWASPFGRLEVSSWLDPHTIKGLKFMYPTLLDHDSPRLGEPDTPSSQEDALSYALTGNTSLHLYGVLSRRLLVRLPVAWPPSSQPTPPGPFPPVPPVPQTCHTVNVTMADMPAVSGLYTRDATKPTLWTKDASHNLYCIEHNSFSRRTLGHQGVAPVYYIQVRGGRCAATRRTSTGVVRRRVNVWLVLPREGQ